MHPLRSVTIAISAKMLLCLIEQLNSDLSILLISHINEWPAFRMLYPWHNLLFIVYADKDTKKSAKHVAVPRKMLRIISVGVFFHSLCRCLSEDRRIGD